MQNIVQFIKEKGATLGFQQIAVTDTDLSSYHGKFEQWLEQNFHGEMNYMSKHGIKRLKPDALIPNTLRVITARMNYLPPHTDLMNTLSNPKRAYVSRYALGKDYHKLIRKRLSIFAKEIQKKVGTFGYRTFCDSAPVLEKPLAEKSGLGWIGKHTNLINAKAGSWFFLGEIFTDMPLPIDTPQKRSHCGSCTACMVVCPTQAIVAPYQLDARRCISYLTIELRGSIPIELRPLIGNRIYGCDDCQLVCPWNKFAKFTDEKAFHPRHQLESAELLTLFQWSEQEFLAKTEGSSIRRIGYECWQRNIAVALGNAPYDAFIVKRLKERLATTPSLLVKEHIEWALQNLNN